VETNRGLPGLAGSLRWYPHPFTIEFYGLFARLRNPEEAAAVKRRIYAEYGRECAVLFVSREPAAEASDSLRSLLDDLLINALMDTILKQTMHALEYLSSSGGGIAILTFERVEEALAFAHELQTRFAENGVAVRMALDFGPVLAFQDREGRGIAGDPVNLASKLAEDLGEPGRIRITERAARRFPATPAGDSFEVTISGVHLKGISLQN
jgi:class 3 adenylate cyclase